MSVVPEARIASTVTVTQRARRGDLALLWHQVRYEQLSFWRNPQSAIFTFALPVVFITVLGAVLGQLTVDRPSLEDIYLRLTHDERT